MAVAFIVCGSGFGLGASEAPPAAWIGGGRMLAYFPLAAAEVRLLKVADGSSEVLLSREALAELQGSDERCSETSWRLVSSNHDAQWLLLGNLHKIVQLDLTTRRPRVLLSSKNPITHLEISPDGRSVSFLRRESIELLDIDSGSVRPLLRRADPGTSVGAVHAGLQSQFDMPAGYWWAPDSSAIAYLQSDVLRTEPFRAGEPLPSTALWIYSVRDGSAHEVDLGNVNDGYIPLVRSFRDSRRLLAATLNREQNALSLVVAHSSPKPATLLFEERDPYWLNITSNFKLSQDGEHLLWSSERSGYRHLEWYDLQTHRSRPLTAGKWEITNLSYVNEHERQVYFTSTLGGPTERGLYRAPFEGGIPTRVGGSSGTHAVSFRRMERFILTPSQTW